MLAATQLFAQAAIRTVPIVAFTDDMLGAGLVRSLARPGGNTTGVSLLAADLNGKRQEILFEAVPSARVMAALADVNMVAPAQLQVLQNAARGRGVDLATYEVRSFDESRPRSTLLRPRALQPSMCWARRCSTAAGAVAL